VTTILISRRTYIKDRCKSGLGMRLVRSKQFGSCKCLKTKNVGNCPLWFAKTLADF
jgi:hypothetical protein